MKRLSKLILAAFLTAGMFTFSGCIENVEPAGIADLRGAKAELLRAQTALEAAKAAKLQAEAAMEMAKVKVQEAIAKQEEAKVEYFKAQAEMMKAQAELEGIKNEKEREKLNALIEKHKQEMIQAQNEAALAAARLEKDLLAVETALLKEQAEYEKALKALELAKAELDPATKAKITVLQSEIEAARATVYEKTKAYKKAGADLTAATAEADPENSKSIALRNANKAVADAQAAYDAAVEAEAIAKDMMNLDATVEEWVKTLDELKLQKENLEKEADVTNAANYARLEEIQDSLDNVIEPAAEKYAAYTGYSYNNVTGKFSIVPGAPVRVFDIPDIYVKAPQGSAVVDFILQNESYTYGKEYVILDKFENAIIYAKLKMDQKYLQEQLGNYEKSLEHLRGSLDYKVRFTRHSDAATAYTSGNLLPYLNKYVYIPGGYDDYPENYDINRTVKEYNDALTAFEAAIQNYETLLSAADISEEAGAAMDVLDAEVKVAEEAKAKVYEEAEIARKEAYIAHVGANAAFEDAQVAWDRCMIDNNYDELSFMEQWLEANPAPETAEDKVLHEKYTLYVKNLTNGRALYDKAYEAKMKADSDYQKAKNAYMAKVENADKVYERAVADAERKYRHQIDALDAAKPTVDIYLLRKEVMDAEANLEDAISLIYTDVEGNIASTPSRWRVIYTASKGMPYQYDIYVDGVPEYLETQVYDPVYNRYDYKLVPLDLEKIKDLEVFKRNHLLQVAEQLSKIKGTYYMSGYDINGNLVVQRDYQMTKIVEGPEYPVKLLSVEEFLNRPENIYEEMESRAKFILEDHLLNYDGCASVSHLLYQYEEGLLAQELHLELIISEVKENIEDLADYEAFVAALEKAREDFVSLVAANEAEMADLKAEVEAKAPRLIEEKENLETATDAIETKVRILQATIGKYEILIEGYFDGMSKEDFEAELEAAYDDAVAATYEAETKLIEASNKLEETKAGLISAVEAAQLDLEKAEAELNDAKDKLDKLVAELDALINILYGVPEAPAA